MAKSGPWTTFKRRHVWYVGRSKIIYKLLLIWKNINWNFSLITFLIIIFKKEKGEIVYEPDALFKVDEYGFFIYWKSEGKVNNYKILKNKQFEIWISTGRACAGVVSSEWHSSWWSAKGKFRNDVY